MSEEDFLKHKAEHMQMVCENIIAPRGALHAEQLVSGIPFSNETQVAAAYCIGFVTEFCLRASDGRPIEPFIDEVISGLRKTFPPP